VIQASESEGSNHALRTHRPGMENHQADAAVTRQADQQDTAVVDTNGLPVRLAVTAGEAHDDRLADKLLSRLKSGSMLLADRGYDADWIRALAARKGVLANIPPRCNRTEPICFGRTVLQQDQALSSDCNALRQARANYLAFVQLASIRLWLRFNESTS
jgi:transposase